MIQKYENLKKQISELEGLDSKHKHSEETLMHALREAYDELEKLVEERTSDLMTTNRQLEQEIAERMQVEEMLHYRGEFERLITTLSTDFIKLSHGEINKAIMKALRTIGEFIGVDRCYLVFSPADGKRIGDTYEWCAKDIKSQVRTLKARLIENELPWFRKKIHRRSVFYVANCKEIPSEANAEKEYFKVHDIKSFIIVPMICGGSFIGFMGFDSVRTKKKWAIDIIGLLRIVGQIFANALERSWMEEALRNSENKYRLLFESASDGIAILDAHGNIINCNNSYMEFLGLCREDIVGKQPAEFFTDKHKVLFQKQFAFVKKKDQVESEYEIIRKDKKTIPIWCKATAICDESGDFKNALLHCRDITEQKQNMEILRKNGQENLNAVESLLNKEIYNRKLAENRVKFAYAELDQIFNTAADGMAVIDKDFKIFRINKRLSEMLGIDMDKEESLKKYCYEVFQSPLCHTKDCPMVRISEGEDHTRDDIEIESKDGAKISCILTAATFRRPNGEQIGIIENFKDIAEHVRLQNHDTLEKNFLLNTQLINISQDGFFVVDCKGNLVDTNQGFSDLMGYSRDELLCMKIEDFDVGNACADKIKRKTKKGFERFRTKYRKKDGGTIQLEIFIGLIHRENDKFFVSYVRDITEIMEMERQNLFLSTVFDHSDEGIALVDLNDNLLAVNRNFASMHDYTPEELRGKNVSIFHSSKMSQYIKTTDSQLQETGNYKGEVWHARRDGTLFPTSIYKSFLKDDTDNLIGKVVIIRDITKEKQLYEKLLDNKEMDQLLQKAITESAVLVAIDGVILAANERAIQNFDKPIEEFLGMCIYDFLPPDLAKTRRVMIKEVVNLARPIYFQKENYCPILDEQGKVMKVVILSQDITGRQTKKARQKEGKEIQDIIAGYQDKETYIHSDGHKGYFSIVEHVRRDSDYTCSNEGIISRSHQIRKLFDILPAIAESVSTVLIEGESGTGKHLFAKAIHNRSHRKKKPFIALNCGALPDTLLESELFGYKAGAFTDAKKDKLGRFAIAEGGTLFLDEIGDISPAMQVRLLRFLQEKVYEPLGSVKSIKADVRIIAATNKNLMDLVKTGRFRQDLFYRINVVRLDLPPLRERLEDVPILIDYFIAKMNEQQGKKVMGISDDALVCLLSHNYPGNIRELENIIERAIVLCRTGRIEKENLPGDFYGSLDIDSINQKGQTPLMRMEAVFLMNVLRENNWNRLETARQLGIHKATLFRKIKSLGLKLPSSGKRSGD